MQDQDIKELLSKHLGWVEKGVNHNLTEKTGCDFMHEYGVYSAEELKHRKDKTILFKACAQALVPGTMFSDELERSSKNRKVVPFIFLLILKALAFAAIGAILGLIIGLFIPDEYFILCIAIASVAATVMGAVLPSQAGSEELEMILLNPFVKTFKEARKNFPEYLQIAEYANHVRAMVQYNDEDKEQFEKIIKNTEQDVINEKIALRELCETVSSLKATLKRVTTSSGRSSATAQTSTSSSSTVQSGYNPNARREITDEAGRTQGYTENGRIYNSTNDVVGHIEGNLVYDKDYKRIGEVKSDGRITKYK